MTPHDVLIKALHGALTGLAPVVVADLARVYRWSQATNQTWRQTFVWQIWLKELLAGLIGGIAGAFGLNLMGINI